MTVADEKDLTDELVETPSEDEGKGPPVDEAPPEEVGEVDEQPPAQAKGKTKAKEEPAAPAPRQRDDRVPLATFLQEKKKFGDAIGERDAKIAALEARLSKIENPEKPAPSYEQDPKGFIEHATAAATKPVLQKLEEVSKAADEIKGGTKAQREEAAQQRFMAELQDAESHFVQTHDDYYDALNHVRQIAYQQIAEFNPAMEHDQILQAISQQELMMAARALDQGKNPHELAYKLAQINGYKKAEKKQAPAKTNGKGPAKAPVLPDDDALPPEDSLGASGGGGDDVQTDDEKDPFDQALEERLADFMGRKRA